MAQLSTAAERVEAIASIYKALVVLGARRLYGPQWLKMFLQRATMRVSVAECERALQLAGYVKTPTRANRTPMAAPVKGWHRTQWALPLPGLYAAIAGNELLYIGSSSNIAARVHDHEKLLNLGVPFVLKVRYCEPKSFSWLTAEARLIARLQPRLNLQYRRAVNRSEVSALETATLPVLSRALEGRGRTSDVLDGGAWAVDRLIVRNA